MKRMALLAVIAGIALTGCTRGGAAAQPQDGVDRHWRTVATQADRERLRNWRKAWVSALADAGPSAAGVIAAQGPLLDPDHALTDALPATGHYRCKIYKFGAQRATDPHFAELPTANCRIIKAGMLLQFIVDEGAQRPSGILYPETDKRVVFLGALELGDERSAPRYGQDAKRDMVGYIERVGTSRWRLALPYPNFQSQLDVIEIIPS